MFNISAQLVGKHAFLFVLQLCLCPCPDDLFIVSAAMLDDWLDH